MRGQISHCYSANRLTTTPVHLLMTSFNDKIANDMNVLGTTHESWLGVEWWTQSYSSLYDSADETFSTVEIGTEKGKPRARAKKEDLIYLSGDSSNILLVIDPMKTYIIGGLVDKNRYKSLCLNKAIAEGIAHAQLPIGNFLPELQTRKVLTVNHVVEIMIKWIELRDWEQAFLAIMPKRKFKIPGEISVEEEGDNSLVIELEEEE